MTLEWPRAAFWIIWLISRWRAGEAAGDGEPSEFGGGLVYGIDRNTTFRPSWPSTLTYRSIWLWT